MGYKKVLVLGAGASKEYGFPLGGELRQRILGISKERGADLGIFPPTIQGAETFGEFQVAFKHSQMYSIDAFLGRRREFAEIGKKCIATILLECENQQSLFFEHAERDHWYQYLFNHLAKNDWDDLTFEDIAVVTFNYDRSLQSFLFVTLQSAYGRSAEEAREKLSKLHIVHVYGSLCDSLPGARGYLKYDGSTNASKVQTAARGIIVIPEGRADSESLRQARALLSSADAVAFLGFGFDPINVERLSEDGACAYAMRRDTGIVIRSFFGTCIGIEGL